MPLKIFHVIGTGPKDKWDYFSDFVCIAPDAAHAQRSFPKDGIYWSESSETWIGPDGEIFSNLGEWDATPATVEVVEIGTAHKGASHSIVCTSFHAG